MGLYILIAFVSDLCSFIEVQMFLNANTNANVLINLKGKW